MGITTNQPNALISVDQAVFTSIRSPMGEGYRIIAASSGVRPEEKAEITRRAPSHGALCDVGESAAGMMAFLLTSGRHCVGFACHAGKEHTGRGGLRVYSHFVLLSAEEFARFGSHAGQAVLAARSAVGEGLVLKQNATPGKINLAITDRWADLPCKDSDRNELKQVIRLARLMMSEGPGAVAMCQDGVPLIDAALTCVPAAIRARLALSAGIQFSPSRQLQLCVVNPDLGQTQRAMRGLPMPLVDCGSDGAVNVPGPFDAWFDFVSRKANARASGEIAWLTARLERSVSPERLTRLVRLCDDLDSVQRADETMVESIQHRWNGTEFDAEPESSLLGKLHVELEAQTAETTRKPERQVALPLA